MYPPLAQEPVEQPVPRPACCRSTRQTDRKLDVSALMIDVTPEQVDISFKKNIRNTPPLVRQMTSEDDLSEDEVVVADPKSRDTFVGGPTSTTPKIARLIMNLAGDVTAGVVYSADLAGYVTAGVATFGRPC